MLAYRVLPLSHHSAKLYHAALHTATLVLVGIALTAVFYFHEINHYPHLSALLPADLSTHLARCQLASSLIHSLKACVPLSRCRQLYAAFVVWSAHGRTLLPERQTCHHTDDCCESLTHFLNSRTHFTNIPRV